MSSSNNHHTTTPKRVTLVGVGRLGICTALVLEKAGFSVLGCDVVPSYVDLINNKTLRSNEPRVEEMLKSSKNFKATTSMKEAVEFADVIFILVATPTGTSPDQAYDCGTLSNVLSGLNDFKLKNKHIVINCTVMPGYCDRVGKHLLRDCMNCTLNYNPEFIAQGNVIQGLLQPDMVLIGEGSTESGDILQSMYKQMCENQPKFARMSVASAEITKLAVNCFITTKISFANMVGEIADRTPNANKDVILQAVGSDSRIGNKCLLSLGPYGGPCFPRDSRALGHFARSVGVEPLLCEATDAINKQHADFMATEMLKSGKDHYVMEDVAYKPKCPVDIIEESGPLEVAKRLVRAGKRVTIRDRPAIVELTRRTYGSMFDYDIVMPSETTSTNGDGTSSSSSKRLRSIEPNTDLGNPLSSYKR
jgi:UDPglucose 6-dehydrogenase